MIRAMEMTPERKEIFLRELRRHGIILAAARAASPATDSRTACVSSFYWTRNRDPEFAAEWDTALAEASADVELEIHRRAVEGYEEPVYQKGELVGTITRYSDRLLELRAKGLMPDRYAVERKDVRVQGKIEHDHQHKAVLLELRPEDVILLPEDKRETLLELLEEIAEAKGDEPVPHLLERG
ncbi:hypothetical protein EBL85_13610 [Marichromatium sp. AB32]|nr:hypothetical protein EBL85_13610 [Marichromatium sp. AB32]